MIKALAFAFITACAAEATEEKKITCDFGGTRQIYTITRPTVIGGTTTTGACNADANRLAPFEDDSGDRISNGSLQTKDPFDGSVMWVQCCLLAPGQTAEPAGDIMQSSQTHSFSSSSVSDQDDEDENKDSPTTTTTTTHSDPVEITTTRYVPSNPVQIPTYAVVLIALLGVGLVLGVVLAVRSSTRGRREPELPVVAPAISSHAGTATAVRV